MARLVPEALYRDEDFMTHYHRAVRRGDCPTGDAEIPKNAWERAAQRIREIDPHGRRSHALPPCRACPRSCHRIEE